MVITVNDWNDLDSVRNNLGEDVEFQSDLDSSTAGYDSLAGPNANGGSGWDPIGNIDNNHEGDIIGNNYTISDLYIDRPNNELVGLFGVKTGVFSLANTRAPVSNLGIRRADITGRGDQTEGGVGAFAGVCTLVDFTECFVAESQVSGDFNVGGFTGYTNGVKTQDVWTKVDVEGETVGGMFGTIQRRPDNSTHQYDNLFSFGNVTEVTSTESESGGIVAYITEGTASDIPNNGAYWDTEASGQSNGVIGTGLTTSEMQGTSPESTMSELDYTNVWETQTSDYPILRSFTLDDQRPPPPPTSLSVNASDEDRFGIVLFPPDNEWFLDGQPIGRTVEEIRTWDNLELTIRYGGGVKRSLINQLKSNSGKVDIVVLDTGGFRAVDLADGNNTFNLEAPLSRPNVHPVDRWVVADYDEETLDKSGDSFVIDLDLTPITEKTFDNEFGTFDSEPNPTRATNEWLFDFEFGAVATKNVSVGIEETGDGAEDIYTLQTVMTPEETRVIEENLGYLNTVTLRNVPDDLDVLEDTSSDSRNTINIIVPDGVSGPIDSGDYITESFETEWIGGAYQVVLEVGQT